MQDLLETVHFLTRVKVAPVPKVSSTAVPSEGEARRPDGGKLSCRQLTRAWQMLLKA